MAHEIFKHIPTIEYRGEDNNNPLAYNWYDAEKIILGKSLKEHLRFAVCYWHSFNWTGNDVFGEGAFNRPWLTNPKSHRAALEKLDAAFDFISKLGAPFFCFHDVDVAAHADTVKELSENLKRISDPLKDKMQKHNIELLWGTANLFSHPRYMAGAATNPDPEVFKLSLIHI